MSILEEKELTVEQFACAIGRSTAVAQKILDGVQVVDSELAQRLSRTLGASDTFWLAREYDYRASLGSPKNTKVASLAELLGRLPLSDMQKFGWIDRAQSKDEKIAACLTFFGVSSLAQWQGRYECAFQQASYRRSTAYASCEIATTAWLRQGEIETEYDKVGDWSPKNLRSKISHFRRLTWYKSPALFLPKLKEFLAECGVKFAVVRAPKGCSASGAVRLISHGTPHIQLSFRFLSDDQFWFSFFHEIGHLLLHYDRMPIFENGGTVEEICEREANEFAANVIVPVQYREEMASLGAARLPIINFAKKIGVAPGLVVGQLQHEGLIDFKQMQHLKRRYRWVN
ncbi:ImmA/IrrE family metallo-endopeptidase [Roseospira goensis]|uniref:Plasmid maintenance system antidote protein VapI n=1 Tax=Roseospira goensis TaxID=391922 RepID=A0A7W6WKG3_9PROT|nr:ImmA/IrrE family metallo-endopeptidase [Roseospira goensis]MBB4286080.1 plasmid maintenance system antidote protein VapI [Roseospira goensis]